VTDPICVQGPGPGAVVATILGGMAAGGLLTAVAVWVGLLRAPMPSVWPELKARWRKPLTWPSVLVWAWIVAKEVWRHTRGKAKQVRDNAVGREVANSDDATVKLPPHPHRTRRHRTGGRHV